MITEVKTYTMLCDKCEKDLCAETDYAGFDSEDYIKQMAVESGWESRHGEDICFDCLADEELYNE
jgi:hypothetical protein